MYEHDQPLDRSIGKHGSISRDRCDPETRRLFGELAVPRVAAGIG
jgi:hypothetical protein